MTVVMKRVVQCAALLALGAGPLATGQEGEVKRVLAGMREALGGEEKLASLKTVAVEGRTLRSRPDGTSSGSNFEMYVELPDKFVKKEVIAELGPNQIARRSGFNGAELIDEVDTPPALGGGQMVFRRTAGSVDTSTPEGAAEQRARSLAANRREFARLALGMFGAAPAGYPLTITYGGQAESPDGKADILDLRHADGFSARLFVDAASHLPLMLTWMDKEPLRMTTNGGSPGNVQVMTAGGHRPTPEEITKMREDMDRRVKEAEAARRTVEYRMFYAEYRTINGIRLPSKIQRMVDGVPTEEIDLEQVKVNSKIDAGKFKPVK